MSVLRSVPVPMLVDSHRDWARKDRFQLLEAGRGIAATMVVVHHAAALLGQPDVKVNMFAQGFFHSLNVGVDFFFVLSGFIITWVHSDDFGRKARIAPFLRKRFLRIYPTYWFVLVVLFGFYAIDSMAAQDNVHGVGHVVASFLLIPYIYEPVLGVAWTLNCEILFYALFALSLWLNNRAIFFWWSIILIVLLPWTQTAYPFNFIFAPVNLEFLMGMGVALFLKQRTLSAPFSVALVGAALFVGLLVWPITLEFGPSGRIGFGVASALFVAGAVELERHREILLPKWIAMLGVASYSIYLSHPLAIAFCGRILRKSMLTDIPAEIILFSVVTVAVVGGILMHVVIERPLIAFSRKAVNTWLNSRNKTDVSPIQ